MAPRQTSDERDDRQSTQMGEIRATLETATRDRSEQRDIMKAIEKTLTEIQVAISRMVAIQEGNERRLTRIEQAVGDDKDGLTGRITKVEGIQMLDQSEISDLDKRTKALEDKADDANKKINGRAGRCLPRAVRLCLAAAAHHPVLDAPTLGRARRRRSGAGGRYDHGDRLPTFPAGDLLHDLLGDGAGAILADQARCVRVHEAGLMPAAVA
jgi:hypothetical protein